MSVYSAMTPAALATNPEHSAQWHFEEKTHSSFMSKNIPYACILFWDRVSFWRAMFVYLLTCVHGCRCLWRLERGIGSLSARFPSGCEPPLWVLGIELESFAKVGYSTLQPWNGVTCSPGKSLTGCELRRTLNFWFSYFPTAGISGTNQCTWFI